MASVSDDGTEIEFRELSEGDLESEGVNPDSILHIELLKTKGQKNIGAVHCICTTEGNRLPPNGNIGKGQA